jgi:hypothetical protein
VQAAAGPAIEEDLKNFVKSQSDAYGDRKAGQPEPEQIITNEFPEGEGLQGI